MSPNCISHYKTLYRCDFDNSRSYYTILNTSPNTFYIRYMDIRYAIITTRLPDLKPGN